MTDILPVRMSSARERRVLAHPPASTEPLPRIVWERIDTEAYAVSVGGHTVGFIDVVGRVFVALGGARYDRAVEIAQTLVFEAAVASLVRIADDPRQPGR